MTFDSIDRVPNSEALLAADLKSARRFGDAHSDDLKKFFIQSLPA